MLLSNKNANLPSRDFALPGSGGLSLCRRRSCTVTWTTRPGRRLTAAARTCACVPTAWPCRMPLPRWPCCSSSAAACSGWPSPQPSTVITWSRLRPEELRTWPELKSVFFFSYEFITVFLVNDFPTCNFVMDSLLGSQLRSLQLPVQCWSQVWSGLLETRVWNHPSGWHPVPEHQP